MKNIFLSLLLLFLVFNLTGCKSDFETSEDSGASDIVLKKIIKNCDKLQQKINMRIIPTCHLRGLLSQLNYTKQEALNYCLESWDNCEEDVEYAWSSLGGDYGSICRGTVFKDKEFEEYGGSLKTCIMEKLITNNKLTKEQAIDYCKKDITGGEGTCEEKIKEIELYKKQYLND